VVSMTLIKLLCQLHVYRSSKEPSCRTPTNEVVNDRIGLAPGARSLYLDYAVRPKGADYQWGKDPLE